MKGKSFIRNIGRITTAGILCATLLAGCGASEQETGQAATTAESGSAGTAAAEKTPASGAGEKNSKAALVVIQSLGDNGPADGMNNGLKQAEKDFGIEVTTYEALQADQYEESLRNFAQNGYNMVITAFPGMNQAIQAVAKDFPEVKFVHIYSSEDYGLENVSSVDFACWEANYICGVGAALASDSDLVGHIVGSEDNTIRANYNALLEGARSVNPNAKVELVNAGTFDDPAKGKEIALSLYSKGAGVIVGDAGKTTLGIIEAAEETGNLAIGDASDHSSLAPGNVFMDTKLGFGDMVYKQIENMVNGEFTPGLTSADYSNEGIGTFKNAALETNTKNDGLKGKLVDIWNQIDQVEKEIAEGSLTIEKNIAK